MHAARSKREGATGGDANVAPRNAAARRAAGLLAVGGVGALLLRLHGLGATGLWLDEAYSTHLSALSLGELVEKLGREATPPLYYLLLGFWSRFAGFGEWGLRSLSVLASLAGLAVLVRLCWQHASPRAACFVLLLAGVAPIHIYHAQEVRMYALLALLVTTLVALALRALERPTAWTIAAAGTATLLALLTHNVAAWAVAGIDVAFVVVCRDPRARWRWFGAQGVAGLAYLPWFATALGQIHKQGALLEWFAPFWAQRSLAGHALDSATSFTAGPFPTYLALGPGLAWGGWVALAAVAVAASAGLRRDAPRAGRFIGIALLVGFALSLGYSALFAPVHIPGRTDHAFQPLFACLLAIGVARLRPQLVGTGLALAFAALFAAQLPAYYDAPGKRASARWVDPLANAARPGDLVITAGLAYAEALHHLVTSRRPEDAIDVQGFPMRLAGAPAYLSGAEVAAARPQLATDATVLARQCERVLAGGGRCFAVLAAPEGLTGPLMERLGPLAVPHTLVGVDAGAQLSLLRTPVRVLRFGR